MKNENILKESQKLFDGSFIKSKRYIAHLYIKKLGYSFTFDNKLFEKVSNEIVSVLGDKKKYDIFEASKYFKEKYQAFQIPWEYCLHYTDTSITELGLKPACLQNDETNPFEYNNSGKEQNITLVIDTVYNKSLRNNYANILLTEGLLLEHKKNVSENEIVYLHSNPIIVIGSLDNKNINSMARFYGEYHKVLNIPDIEYEMWFFHEHS
ncbi:MAG TPA: hypothetical protein VIL26_04115 [Clostridia bacterium]